MAGTHTVSETDPWTINVGDHPARKDSPTYVKSRALMVAICKEVGVPFYGDAPWQDHHSGILWVYDGSGWRSFKNLVGLEWSSQFCADPAKVEVLRKNAVALYSRFPETENKFAAMGHNEQYDILNAPITDAEGVAKWTDSIFNASMPLPQPVHTGTIKGDEDGSKPIAGIHYYPLPVWDIQFVKHDDYALWVTDEEGHPAAVVPTHHRGDPNGDGSVEVVHAHPGSKLEADLHASHAAGQAHRLPAHHTLAQQAFRNQ